MSLTDRRLFTVFIAHEMCSSCVADRIEMLERTIHKEIIWKKKRTTNRLSENKETFYWTRSVDSFVVGRASSESSFSALLVSMINLFVLMIFCGMDLRFLLLELNSGEVSAGFWSSRKEIIVGDGLLEASESWSQELVYGTVVGRSSSSSSDGSWRGGGEGTALFARMRALWNQLVSLAIGKANSSTSCSKRSWLG